ncbi:MAG: hypothetical protein D3918_10480 [Candidatus Electrothrix sp. AX2]|nr:hypothetical protein [Candidatus Electrothrix gigas]
MINEITNYLHPIAPSFFAPFFIAPPSASFTLATLQAEGKNTHFILTGSIHQAISLASSPDRSKILHFLSLFSQMRPEPDKGMPHLFTH